MWDYDIFSSFFHNFSIKIRLCSLYSKSELDKCLLIDSSGGFC